MLARSELYAWIAYRSPAERHISVSRGRGHHKVEGGGMVDKPVYCPDCLDNDELVVMERHEWPVEGYYKMVCPVCGCTIMGMKEGKKDE